MTQKMTVGLVVTGFDKGGLEQVVYNLYCGCWSMGVPAYILCEDPTRMGYFASQLYDVRHFCIFENKFETFISFCYQKRITHLSYHYNCSFVEQARNCGIKTIYTLHNVYTWMNDQQIIDYANCLKKCDEIIAVSSFVKDYFCTRGNVRKECIKVIPNGINVKELLNEQILPVHLTRKGIGISKTDIVFAQIASFTPVKHQIGLIGVMEKVINRYNNIKLLLVGNALDKDYFRDFMIALKKSPAKNNIIVLDYFDHKYMGQFFREVVDVSVLTTLQEGCSNVVIESIVCSKPMILTKVGNAIDVQFASIILVPTFYENIYSFTLSEMESYSQMKCGRNTEAITNAFLEMRSNLQKYKEKAICDKTKQKSLTMTYMVDCYVNILKNIR